MANLDYAGMEEPFKKHIETLKKYYTVDRMVKQKLPKKPYKAEYKGESNTTIGGIGIGQGKPQKNSVMGGIEFPTFTKETYISPEGEAEIQKVVNESNEFNRPLKNANAALANRKKSSKNSASLLGSYGRNKRLAGAANISSVLAQGKLGS